MANTQENEIDLATVRPRDLEVKDAQIIFNHVWGELVEEYGEDHLCFPKEIFWLNGAPGSGKGTHTRFIMELRDMMQEPVVVSSLLKSPQAKKMIDAGMLVGDREVIGLIFKKLLEPQYEKGAIVDGFPRTKVQVECLKMLHTRLNQLRLKYLDTLRESLFPKPQFHIIVLFIDEKESVARQLKRGQKMIEHNEKVKLSGMGELYEVRATDLDEETTRNRYRTFKEQTYESLKSLRELFHYHFINAYGSIKEVQERIIDELKYQSSLELNQDTYDRLSIIPIAETLAMHARQELISRLENYEKVHTILFKRVVDLISNKFIPIIRRHAISGMATINTENTVFEDPIGLAILLDVFSERGYHATVDIKKIDIPDSIDPKTFKINCRVKKVYSVTVRFKGSDIRRGH
jgi:adenylate kinase